MARTILEICQEAAEREATAPAPATIFGDNNRIARIMRQAIKDTMRDYLRASRWVGQSAFHSQWVFSLKPGRFAYPLPPDYLRMIANTEQRGGWPMGLIGPATPETWARWVSGAAAVTAPMGWRIKGNALFLEPTPANEELVFIEYVSSYLVVSEIKTGDYDLTSQVPVTFAPVVPRDGWIAHDTVVDLAEGPDTFAYDEADGQGWDEGVWTAEPSEILRRINPNSLQGPLPQVRRAGFSHDDDRPAFEDDYLLSLGVTWRTQRALGLPYAEIAAEYEAEKDAALTEDAGGARGFRLGNSGQTVDVLPLGDGKWMVS